MKRLVQFIAVFALGSGMATAQQLPLISSYLNTEYLFNPAFSGQNGTTEITVLNRRQWTDVEGSPETQFMAFNGNMEDQKFGYSGYAFSDNIGVVTRSGFYGSYAYHVRFTDRNSMSLGLGGGYVNNQINSSAIHVEDITDPLLYTQLNRSKFDMNFGVNLTFGEFQLGMGVPNLLAPKVDFSDNFAAAFQYNYVRHFVLNTRYEIELQKDLMYLSPFVIVRATGVTSPQADVGLMFNHKDYFYLGAAYRSSYAMTANAGVHLTDNISFGYAYDISLNTYGYALGNSHEVMLRYTFGKSKKDDRLENEIKRLKDRVRKLGDETEDLINDRLDQFQDEVKAAQEQQIQGELENIKQQVDNATSAMEESAARAGGQQGGTANGGAGTRGGTNAGTASTGAAGGSATGAGGTAGQPQGTIRGYNPDSYAGNVAPGSRGYYVTAGVFGSASNANRLRDRLKDSGIAADVFKDNGNNMYYVFLMKFATYGEAKSAQDSNLNGQYNGSLWIKAIQ